MKRTAMKNTLFIISVMVLSLALACCVLGILLLPIKIVYADSAQEVVCAPVSDLENNECAGASAVMLMTIDETPFYIPESYYVSDVKRKIADYYEVSYCGFTDTFFIKSESTPQTTSVTFEDGVSLSPDVRLTIKEEINIILDGKILSNEYTIKLLGYHTEDASQIFIVASKDGEHIFGFANIGSFENFIVPYHPIAQQERDELIASKYQPDPDNGDIIPNTSLSLRVVLIIGICVPAIIIAFLLFKPSKTERSQGKNTLHRNRKRDEFDYDSPRSYSSDRQNGYDSSRTYSSERQNGYDDGYDRGYSRGYNDARNSRDNRYDN